jgi:hypothetical protein
MQSTLLEDNGADVPIWGGPRWYSLVGSLLAQSSSTTPVRMGRFPQPKRSNKSTTEPQGMNWPRWCKLLNLNILHVENDPKSWPFSLAIA